VGFADLFSPGNTVHGTWGSVLPRGRNFDRKAQKGPKKIRRVRKGQGPNFCPIYQRRAEKGPNFFYVWFFNKSSIFPAKNYTYQLVYLIFFLLFCIMNH
jgi:hypothetical protein